MFVVVCTATSVWTTINFICSGARDLIQTVYFTWRVISIQSIKIQTVKLHLINWKIQTYELPFCMKLDAKNNDTIHDVSPPPLTLQWILFIRDYYTWWKEEWVPDQNKSDYCSITVLIAKVQFNNLCVNKIHLIT